MRYDAGADDELDASQISDRARLAMAADRTMLAMERTYAAWVRTGLAALASGVAARAFVESAVSPIVGTIMASLLIVFSVFCFLAGVWREVKQVSVATPPDLRHVPPMVLVGANAVMSAVSILALVGLWIAPA